jgi:monoamine oxidase
VDAAHLNGRDPPMSEFLEFGSRWNALINAVSSYFSGAETERVSTQDLQNYADTEINWRAVNGYGALVASHARGLDVTLNCKVLSIDWSGVPLRIETSFGTLECQAAIVTLPTDVLARWPELFSPPLPEKTAAAERLPLGLADKLYLSFEGAEEFAQDSRLFGHTDRTATAIYHMRPLGRPLIECYFGGACADDLERGGPAAFFEFARAELTGLLGNAFKNRIAPLPMHLWRADEFSLGAYSYAEPGHAADRATLASSVGGRLFFAGEACSRNSYSTAHGAFESGIRAADEVSAAR